MMSIGSGGRRTWRRALVAVAVCGMALAPRGAEAQEYPSRTVKIVVPAAAGGALDAISRLMAPKVAEAWKQPVIIENKPGANWIVGMDLVAKSPPDGYTFVFVASAGLTINPHVFPKMPLDPLRDLVPITTATSTPFVLLASPSVPAKTLPELVAHLKSNPGKFNHGSNSSSTMLISELFKARAGVDYVDVNFRGASESMVATMANTTQFCFVDLGSGSSAIEGKTLNAMGLTSRARYALKPEIPTIAEQGLPGYAAMSSTILLAPAKTPPEIIQKASAAFRAALRAPDVVAKLTGMGQVVEAAAPDDIMREMTLESEQWKQLIRERNIQFGQR